MILKDYTSGHYQKDRSGYDFFVPTKINESWIWTDSSINQLTEKAAIKLGELNSFTKLVPNIDLFIRLHVTKEAVISSKIEGTRTQIGEALMQETSIAPERRNDWKEVNNYITALNSAITDLEHLPISSRLIKQTHKILLDNVRGKHKMPGAYRTSQNWIGGSNLQNATFVPPHATMVADLMYDLENFIHNEEINIPDLIKIALVHYQFETIHPFLDGNGRIGRLLITLFFVERNILTKPLLYLSTYFEKNNGLYYDNLTNVRTKNQMKEWLEYFLSGVIETAQKSIDTLSHILELKDQLERQINQNFGRKSRSALLLLQDLFKQPIITVNQTKDITNLSFNAANALIADFVQAGILREVTGFGRNREFLFESYISLFE